VLDMCFVQPVRVGLACVAVPWGNGNLLAQCTAETSGFFVGVGKLKKVASLCWCPDRQLAAQAWDWLERGRGRWEWSRLRCECMCCMESRIVLG
jgi:hypothetical protein